MLCSRHAALSRAGACRPGAFTTRPAAINAPSLARPQQRNSRLGRPLRAIELDFSDPDTQLSVAGVVLGLLFGIGAPYFYNQQTERDEKRLEELRALNRATFEETGEYLSEKEIAAFRKPRWTDKREWVDDD